MKTEHLYKVGQETDLQDFVENKNVEAPQNYNASDALTDAVNVAIALGKPLLLTGEPGTGKTRLAHSVAYWFKLGKPLVFNTKTSSQATDLFYRYDALQHLHYVQTRKDEGLSENEITRRFIHYQALGKAIRSGERQVVLIDEIDKAPRDFPNDILNSIEDMEFEVPEIGETFRAQTAKRPVVIITSNSEKNLPEPFLRRCVYYHIPFPTPEQLLNILSKALEGTSYSNELYSKYLIPFFSLVRSKSTRKPPATAELIFWAIYLEKYRFAPVQLQQILKNNLPQEHENYPQTDRPTALDASQRKILEASLGILAKTQEDMKAVKRLLK